MWIDSILVVLTMIAVFLVLVQFRLEKMRLEYMEELRQAWQAINFNLKEFTAFREDNNENLERIEKVYNVLTSHTKEMTDIYKKIGILADNQVLLMRWIFFLYQRL